MLALVAVLLLGGNAQLQLQEMNDLLRELDQIVDQTNCPRALSSPLVHQLLNQSVEPRLLFLAELLAATPRQLTEQHRHALNASIAQRSPVPLNGSSPVFYLEKGCDSPRWQPVLVFPSSPSISVLLIHLNPVDVDACALSACQDTKCSWSVHGGLRVHARACCDQDNALCVTVPERSRQVLYLLNSACCLLCLALIALVVMERRRGEHMARGWALMEIFLIGAAVLYSTLLVDWLSPYQSFNCCIAVWLRQLGFCAFYGSIVLKIYRNLQEYRVRKAHHVFVKEQDLLKYLGCMLATTTTGLIAWTGGTWRDEAAWKARWPQCPLQTWALIWHGYELLFLLYGIRLCYKARNSGWMERWQFTVAICLETIVTLVANLLRYSLRDSAHTDTLLTITFVQLQLTVSVNIVIIMAPKFYLVTSDNTRRTLTMTGGSSKAHPSLAKLRDNLLNGTIDFAEVPIVDMNPEDIRAELKRVYTQLRMYKLKNLYQDNPHISKRKGGKKVGAGEKGVTGKLRRISIPPTAVSPKLRRVDEDDKSDLTVESAPHNVYLSTQHHTKLPVESDTSVRV